MKKKICFCCRQCKLYVDRENGINHDYSEKHQVDGTYIEFEDTFLELKTVKFIVMVVVLYWGKSFDGQQNSHKKIVIETKIEIKSKPN